jgi:antitoxin component of MazEF toxin-antitoxin module
MSMNPKVIKIGDGLGIILPKKLLAHLKAGVGDTLTATVKADGVDLVLADVNFDQQLASARDVMAKRKRALSKLK